MTGRRNFIETKNDFCLVIDSGHSFTHIVPFLNGRNIMAATTRIDVGGMMITNSLKKALATQVDLNNEFSIVNDIKEDCCYVSKLYKEEIQKFE